VVSTPIGNLRDVTLRALDVLASVDRVFAEDTRVTLKLLNAYGLKARLSAYHEHNADSARREVLAALADGERVALVSDAGTPLVSDPGCKLVRSVIEAGHRIIPVPGASAALAALAAAGLPTDRFLFAGFPPAKKGARERFFEELATTRATLVFYETGPRLAQSLAAMAAAFGPRECVVAREMTKLFEEFRRGALDTLAAAFSEAPPPKGEMVVLVAPPSQNEPVDEDSIEAALRAALARLGVKDAAAEVAQRFALSKREVYLRALAIKQQAEDTQ
jgi:16S rRNA (cytidine1402-2'-O)-methyltransferase